MKLKIRGKTWKVQDAPIDVYGMCNWTARRITIRSQQCPSDRLDTIIHECIHAAMPRCSERRVRATAKVIASALWQDRWRKSKKSP